MHFRTTLPFQLFLLSCIASLTLSAPAPPPNTKGLNEEPSLSQRSIISIPTKSPLPSPHATISVPREGHTWRQGMDPVENGKAQRTYLGVGFKANAVVQLLRLRSKV